MAARDGGGFSRQTTSAEVSIPTRLSWASKAPPFLPPSGPANGYFSGHPPDPAAMKLSS